MNCARAEGGFSDEVDGELKMRHVASRLAGFFLFFSVLPLAGSGTATLLLRGGGIRGASSPALGLLAWRADSSFIIQQICYSAVGSTAVAVALATLSLLAWKQSDGHCILRSGRIALLVSLTAAVLFPGIAGWVPILRKLPWTVCVLSLVAAVSLAYAWPGSRAGPREWLFAALVLIGIFFPFRFPSMPLGQLASRPFTARDVFIIGFDSVTQEDTFDLVNNYNPGRGSRTIYTNALTPYPGTSVAWRSVFGGKYPPVGAQLPNLRWGSDLDGWLPTELRSAGYDVTLAQDLPSANLFTRSEGIRTTGPQGWKAELQGYIWTAVFPLSSVGADWWVRAIGGPANLSNNRLAHCAQCFIFDSLREVARSAAKGPVFGAIHTCLVHGPNRLKLWEALRVPGWWHLPATFFLGTADGWSANTLSRTSRMRTVRAVLEATLEKLEREDVLGYATVFVIADHGPRGDNVPQTTTNNVMFAVFSPDGNDRRIVNTPVSLVDIAPTVRKIVSLPEATTDGRVLPLANSEGEAERHVLTNKRVSTGELLRLMGIGKEKLDARELAQLGRLGSDGTYEYAPEIMLRIRELSSSQPMNGPSRERK